MVLVTLILFSSLNSTSAATCIDTSEYGSIYTLEVNVERDPAMEQVIYNVYVELGINKFKPGVTSLYYIRLYAKAKGDTFLETKYIQMEQEITKLPSSPKSVNTTFSFDLTGLNEEITVYGGSSFNEYLTEGLEIDTCTYWLEAQTLALEAETMESNYVGYLFLIGTLSSLIIIKRRRKKKTSD
jgi:hypothetical protein